MNTRITNHILQQTGDQSLVDGLKKHETDLPSFFINGASVKTTDLITTLQARIAAGSNVVSTRASWLTAVQANRDEIAETKTPRLRSQAGHHGGVRRTDRQAG